MGVDPGIVTQDLLEGIALGCTIFSVIFSVWLIYKHLRNYTEPEIQRPICRILLMVPIYAVFSMLSLHFWKLYLWFGIPRDTYESYVIYNFLLLLIAYLRTEAKHKSDIEAHLATKPPLAHPWPLCCIHQRLDRSFFRLCYRMILQFAILDPLIAVVSLVLNIFGKYCDGNFAPNCGYLWIQIVYNISICVALYYLVLFWMALADELAPFRVVWKFISVKSIIFFLFWQGLAISVMVNFHLIPKIGVWEGERLANNLQDFIICVEMLLYSVWHHWVFPFRNFRDPTKTGFVRDLRSNARPLLRALKDVIMNQTSIWNDTKEYFDPVDMLDEASSSVLLATEKAVSHIPVVGKKKRDSENKSMTSLPDGSDAAVVPSTEPDPASVNISSPASSGSRRSGYGAVDDFDAVTGLPTASGSRVLRYY